MSVAGAAADTFTKRRSGAPTDWFAVEAAGLHWLAEAQAGGGADVVRPIEVTRDRLVLARLTPVEPTRSAAEQFGAQLAATHRAGAGWHGCPPQDWTGDGYIGTLRLPHVHTSTEGLWGPFFAVQRLQPFARAARDRGTLTTEGAQAIDRLCARLATGDRDLAGPDEPPARLHGDLWSGNVIWTATGVVLIDPAAHGGHRESDLAMLALFGLPWLDRVLAAYDEAWPLAALWPERAALHQLFPLLVHAALFGSGYGAQAAAIARRY